jgi:hypothetical protein
VRARDRVGRRAISRGRRPRRFTEGGFARFNGTARLAASTAEGHGGPVRHRYNPGGKRRVNAILYRTAITQLRAEPRAKRLYAAACANNHTKKEVAASSSATSQMSSIGA